METEQKIMHGVQIFWKVSSLQLTNIATWLKRYFDQCVSRGSSEFMSEHIMQFNRKHVELWTFLFIPLMSVLFWFWLIWYLLDKANALSDFWDTVQINSTLVIWVGSNKRICRKKLILRFHLISSNLSFSYFPCNTMKAWNIMNAGNLKAYTCGQFIRSSTFTLSSSTISVGKGLPWWKKNTWPERKGWIIRQS